MTLDVGADGIAVIVVAGGGTSLMELRSGDHVSNLGTAALDGDIVLVLGVVELLHDGIPLGIGGIALVGVVGLDLCRGVDTGADPEVLQLVTRHHGLVEVRVGEGRNTVLGTDGNLCAGIVGAGLGGHENDTVRSAGTVDGGGGGILEDRDRKDVVRIHRHDGVTAGRNTVDHIQRSGGGSEGTHTVQLHGDGVVTGDTTGGHDAQTCDLALEVIEGGSGGSILDDVGTDRCNGAHEVTHLLGGTVTDHDGILESLGIGIEGDIDGSAAVYFDLLVDITDRGEHKSGARRHGDTVIAVHISGDTGTRALYLDGSERNRFSIGRIPDLSLYSDVLCGSRHCEEQKQRA